jgi:hypothetical protein
MDVSTKVGYTGERGRGRDLRYIIRQLGHIIQGNLHLSGDGGLNIGWQAIRPQSAKEVGWHRRAGESPEVAEELSRQPVAHLLMH